MNKDKYPEIKPGKKILKKIYVKIMLFVVGRAIRSAARVDSDIKREFEEMPDGFTFSLGIFPDGPTMIIQKNEKGKVKYLGGKTEGKDIDLKMKIKNIEAGILVFTFQESTAVAFAHDRFIVDGDLAIALAVVRILDLVEFYLLPKIVTKLAVARYPKWSEINPIRKYLNRVLIYLQVLIGV